MPVVDYYRKQDRVVEVRAISSSSSNGFLFLV